MSKANREEEKGEEGERRRGGGRGVLPAPGLPSPKKAPNAAAEGLRRLFRGTTGPPTTATTPAPEPAAPAPAAAAAAVEAEVSCSGEADVFRRPDCS